MKRLRIGKSGIDGKGVFADEDIKAGDFIADIPGRVVSKKTLTEEEANAIVTWYGLGNNLWLDPEESAFRYLNHSCDPNAAIVSSRKVVARRDISKGEELAIDYSMTDEDPLWSLPCSCGAKNCRGVIRAIQFLPTDVFLAHMPLIPDYFQRLYISNYILSRMAYDDALQKQKHHA